MAWKKKHEIVEVDQVAKKLWRRKLILHWRHQYSTTKMNNVSSQENKGAEEEGDIMQDFPHSLELPGECGSKKNLEHGDDVAVEEIAMKHRRKSLDELGHDVDKVDDLEILALPLQ